MDARNPDGLLAATITRLRGFLTSVVSGQLVVPSEWMPVVFGGSDDRAWEAMDQARDAMSLVMSLYNEVSSDLGQRGRRYSILIDRLGDEPDTIILATTGAKATCSASRCARTNERKRWTIPSCAFFRTDRCHCRGRVDLEPFDNREN